MKWPLARLSDLCEINVGRTPARANPTFWGEGNPWLSIADMNQGRVIQSTKEQVTVAGAATGRLVDPGTVLLSFKLSIGKVAMAGIPLFTNEAIAALPIKRPELINSDFLMRALEQADLTGESNRAAMGATLNKAKLKEVMVPLPPLPEQRRITAILDHADSLRTKRRQVLTHLDALAQSIFNDMFGRRSDRVMRLDALVDSHDRMNYGVVQPGDSVPNGVPLIRVSDLVNDGVNRTYMKRIDPVVEATYVRSRIRGTEILVSSVGTIGIVSVTSAADVGSNVARAITRVPISDPARRAYVAAFLRSEGAQRYFRSEVRVVAQPTLNVKQLAATPVPLPPEDLQRRFASRAAVTAVHRALALHAVTAGDSLFSALQFRAFRGEL